MNAILNTTAAATVATSANIFDRLIGDEGFYSFDGMSLDDGMKALASALEAKFEAHKDHRFSRSISFFEQNGGYTLYVYVTFKSAADRIVYDEEVRRGVFDDEDPAFDCLDMPPPAKRNLAGGTGQGQWDSIAQMWFFEANNA
jgi:hypothetical protein